MICKIAIEICLSLLMSFVPYQTKDKEFLFLNCIVSLYSLTKDIILAVNIAIVFKYHSNMYFFLSVSIFIINKYCNMNQKVYILFYLNIRANEKGVYTPVST